jgi:hypothetical protein
MKTIWKYVITKELPQSFQIPFGALLRHIDIDPANRGPALWFQLETDHTAETRTFAVLGTGDRIPTNFQYFGTVKDGVYIWHVFEIHLNKASA